MVRDLKERWAAGAVLPFGHPDLDAALSGRGAGPRPEMPLITVAHDGRRRVLATADAAAQALSLQAGLPLAKALERLAAWCLRYAPLTAPDVPDGAWLDITWCAHLWDGEASLLADLLGRLRRSGLCADAAVADTPGAAWAVARHAGEAATIVPPSSQADAFAAPPITTLRLEAEAIDALRRLGLDRVGRLAAVPRAPLARRLGSGVPLCLDEVDPGRGIEAMRLIGSSACQNKGLSGLREPIRTEHALGAGRTVRIAPMPSDVPERAVRPVPASAPPEIAGPETSWPVTLPRPVRLFRPPQPVRALAALPDQPPAAFTWRRVRRRVRRSDGPERIHGEWWLRDGEARTVREYWAVEDEAGHRYWLFRRGNGSDRATGDLGWFLHGLF